MHPGISSDVRRVRKNFFLIKIRSNSILGAYPTVRKAKQHTPVAGVGWIFTSSTWFKTATAPSTVISLSLSKRMWLCLSLRWFMSFADRQRCKKRSCLGLDEKNLVHEEQTCPKICCKPRTPSWSAIQSLVLSSICCGRAWRDITSCGAGRKINGQTMASAVLALSFQHDTWWSIVIETAQKNAAHYLHTWGDFGMLGFDLRWLEPWFVLAPEAFVPFHGAFGCHFSECSAPYQHATRIWCTKNCTFHLPLVQWSYIWCKTELPSDKMLDSWIINASSGNICLIVYLVFWCWCHWSCQHCVKT